MFVEKTAHVLQSAGQILFVAIQVREKFAGGAAETAIYRVIHAGIFFDDGFGARIIGQPYPRAVGGAGILNEVFEFDVRLVSDGRDAEFEPGRLIETGRDDAEVHAGNRQMPRASATRAPEGCCVSVLCMAAASASR